MENMNIAIVTDDKAYGKACGLAILNVCRTLVVNVFDKSEFATVLERNNNTQRGGRFCDGFDIVIWDGPISERPGANTVVFLVDKPSMACRRGEKGQFCIYKYSPAQNMVSDLFEIYGRLTGRMPIGMTGGNVSMYAFAAPAGGTGCSTIAMAVAQELARFHDRSILYLSLEGMESTASFINCHHSGRTMSYYLYNLFKNRRINQQSVADTGFIYRPFLESFMVRDDFGIEAFRPTKGRNPLVDLTTEEIFDLVESLMASGRYDVLIVDVGTELSASARACLEMADRICLVAREDKFIDREINYLQYLITFGGEDMLRKMVKVENKGRLTMRNDFLDQDSAMSLALIDTSLVIEKDDIFAEEGQVKKVLLEGVFGHKISQLTNIIVEPV